MADDSALSETLLRDQLSSSGKELSKLDIPSSKEALDRLSKLLKSSERTKGGDDASKRQLLRLVHRLNRTTLVPIVDATKKPSFSMSEDLQSTLATFFKTLHSGIPKQSLLSRIFPTFRNPCKIVDEANLKITSALSVFEQQGSILVDQDGRCRLQPLSEAGSTTQPKEQELEVDAPIKQPATATTEQAQSPSSAQGVDVQHPRVRILLLGKSGVGKSSLINKMFGEDSAAVSDFQTGQSDIYKEHTSPKNPHVILHDSMGFESGSDERCVAVEEFIKKRNEVPDSDQNIHIIWLCTAIPISGARAFEAGDEQFFEIKVGKVPLIVVFTQYDVLVTKAEMEAAKEGKNTKVTSVQRVQEYFHDLCCQPLEEVCKEKLKLECGMPSFTSVSVTNGYEGTLGGLVKLTLGLLPSDLQGKIPADMGCSALKGFCDLTSAPAIPTRSEQSGVDLIEGRSKD